MNEWHSASYQPYGTQITSINIEFYGSSLDPSNELLASTTNNFTNGYHD